MSAPLDYDARETITIPPGNDRIVVCRRWPDCDCGDGCIDLRIESDVARWIMLGLAIAVAAIGAGLLLWGLLP